MENGFTIECSFFQNDSKPCKEDSSSIRYSDLNEFNLRVKGLD